MTIQYASDLHLEFEDNKSYYLKYPLIKSADILILAGDIFHLNEKSLPNDLLDIWAQSYEQVYIVPGNHEFYQFSHSISGIFPMLEWPVRDNVFIVNNLAKQMGGVRFLFTTLFSHIPPDEAMKFKRSMNDFNISSYDIDSHLPLSIDQYNKCHAMCRAFLEVELEEAFEGNTVIVSHHVPYRSSMIPNYPFPEEGSLHHGFHSDLRLLFEKHTIDYWISGHTHFNHEPLQILQTKCLTNQLGYVSYGENYGFSRDRTLEIL